MQSKFWLILNKILINFMKLLRTVRLLLKGKEQKLVVTIMFKIITRIKVKIIPQILKLINFSFLAYIKKAVNKTAFFVTYLKQVPLIDYLQLLFCTLLPVPDL